MKITIGIPVYVSYDLHLEFTEETVKSIRTKHDTDIVIIQNFCLPSLKLELDSLAKRVGARIVINPKGNVLASSWNYIIEDGISNKSDYIIIPNNDLILHKDCIDNLIKFAEEHKEFSLWSAAEWKGETYEENRRAISTMMEGVEYTNLFDDHPHFSCFMVKNDFKDKLSKLEIDSKEPFPGLFDENFVPAYFEDGDMHQRLLRTKLGAGKTTSAIFYHYGSRTIKIDEDLDLRNRDTYDKNRSYFINKWNFDPHGSVISNDDKRRFSVTGPFEK